MSDSLCPDCLAFQESLQNTATNYDHQSLKPNIKGLHRSAQRGCSLCRVIYQSFIYNEGVSLQGSGAPIDIMFKDSTIDQGSQEPGLEILSVKVWQRGTSCSTYLNVLFNSGGQEQAFETYKGMIGQLQDPSSNDGLESIARLTSKWIQDCRNTHSQCGSQSGTGCLPTRLIDVGTEDDTKPPRLFVPEQDQKSKTLEYAALSYAWGTDGGHLVRTTASNLQAMMGCLPFTQLPQTIQDAVAFTRKLGFRYLWVDAICILQSEGPDDIHHKVDWSYEATRFGHYYQNAIITISATGASSSHHGLFLPRPALEFEPEPVILQRQRPSGESREISILPIAPSWVSEIKRSPLYDRGWAIQERILSTRIVHFAANMVLWECHEGRASEIDQAGSNLDDRDNGVVYEDVSDFMPVFRNLRRDSTGTSKAMREWYSFIEGYTGAKFTFVADRLPALSGIAALIQKYTSQKYAAGLWESAIPEGLAWLVEGNSAVNKTHLTNPSRTKADLQLMLPSWSWAASRGTVRMLSLLDTWETMLEVVDWEVKSTGGDTSGQILGARLRVRGPLRTFDSMEPVLNPHLQCESGVLFQAKKGELDFTRAVFMDEELESQCCTREYSCFLLGTAYVPGSGPKDGVTGCALILQPTGRLHGIIKEYRRIGLLCLPIEDWRSSAAGKKETVDLV